MVERSAYTNMADHPDVMEMRARYERISASPPAVITDDLLLLAGLWLAISPWVLQFHTSTPNVTQSNLIVGIAVAAIGLGMALLPRTMQSLSWATFLIGAWVVVSPWVIQRSSVPVGTYLSNVITGGVIALLGLAAAGVVLTARKNLASARHSSSGAGPFYDDTARTEPSHTEAGTDPSSRGRFGRGPR